MSLDKKELWRRQRQNFPWHEQIDRIGVHISFVVPCFNEEENVKDTLFEIDKCMKSIGNTYEIIVIDDCSTDKTSEKVQEFISGHPDVPVRLRRNLVNQGWAQNFVDGAFISKGKFYRMIPGDNVERAEEMRKVVSLAGTADIIIPYQIVADGKSLIRRALSKLFTILVNILSGNKIKYYNGCSIYYTFDIMRWHDRSSGYAFQAKTLTRLINLGLTFVEVGVDAQERVAGKSKAFNVINVLSTAHALSEIFLQRLKGIWMGRLQ